MHMYACCKNSPGRSTMPLASFGWLTWRWLLPKTEVGFSDRFNIEAISCYKKWDGPLNTINTVQQETYSLAAKRKLQQQSLLLALTFASQLLSLSAGTKVPEQKVCLLQGLNALDGKWNRIPCQVCSLKRWSKRTCRYVTQLLTANLTTHNRIPQISLTATQGFSRSV